MGAIRGFIAASLDGFVADSRGGVDWLKPWQDLDYGYEAFIAEIGTVVMGRATYEQMVGFGMPWPYGSRSGIVVTSRSVSGFQQAEAWTKGVAALIPQLRAGNRDAWVVGGARLQAAFLVEGALDRLDLFVVPVLLGTGIPLFPPGTITSSPMALDGVTSYERGLVRLAYRFG